MKSCILCKICNSTLQSVCIVFCIVPSDTYSQHLAICEGVLRKGVEAPVGGYASVKWGEMSAEGMCVKVTRLLVII